MMSSILIDIPGYDADAKTLFLAMTVQPDSTRKRAISNFISGCKADGNWTLIDVMWMTAAHNQQASRLNWKTPSTFTLTEVNSPTWTANQGYTGNGTNMYLDTAWDASTNGVRFTQNSACHGWYNRIDSIAASIPMGATNASAVGNTINPNSAATFRINWRVNSAAAVGTVNQTTTTGLYYASRVDATDIKTGKNGADVQTIAVASAALTTNDIYILASDNNGTAGNFSTAQISFAFLGSGAVNQSLLYTRVQNYMTALGANV